ncbi:hypothetical protein LTS10_000002 [Elasticomyces elasticus]|nr:hypothetical protein LTS10_000002 [Elasticomyces elasticus]
MRPHGIFSLRDPKAHSKRRNLLSHAFSHANLQECEALVQEQIEKLLRVLQDSAGRPIDMLNWFRLAAFDVVGELFLGQSFGGLDSGQTPSFLQDIEQFFILADLQWNSPLLARAILYIPLQSVRHFSRAMQRLADYGENAFHCYVNQYGRDSGRRDLLTKILSVEPEHDTAPLSDHETSVEVGNLVFAGTGTCPPFKHIGMPAYQAANSASDTTSTTLTFLFWELAQHQEWQSRLRAELRAHAPAPSTFQQVQNLPILDAVINEALRLHPAAPASLPRETPMGGQVLNGYSIPEKTIVSMQCYTTHRDPHAYPEPESFRPERWMDPTAITYGMKELFMPFSKGTRACIGKNLAAMELKLITVNLVRRFSFRPASDTTVESMATKDHFLLVPKGGKCNLVFEEVG